MQRIEGIPPFERLLSESELFERQGMPVRVMRRQTLIELRLGRSSPQDLADIEAIEQLDRLDE